MNFRYAIGLHSNARAFMESAVEHAREGYREDWRFAVLHLATALELLLKAKLATRDHRLLVMRESEITERQFDEGDFKSVTIDECLKRLRLHCEFTLGFRQLQILNAIRNLRNRVAHYIDPGDSAALKAAIGAGLNLFIEIDEGEFIGEDPYGARSIQQLVVDLHKYEEFVRARRAEIAEKLRGSVRPQPGYIDECSHCLQDAAVLIGDDVQCLFCGYVISIVDYADLISEGGSGEHCTNCGRLSLVRRQWRSECSSFECFCCGYSGEPDRDTVC